MIKPALEQLLNHIETHPESGGLKELLAVKKSLTQIQVSDPFLPCVKTCINPVSNEFFH